MLLGQTEVTAPLREARAVQLGAEAAARAGAAGGPRPCAEEEAGEGRDAGRQRGVAEEAAHEAEAQHDHELQRRDARPAARTAESFGSDGRAIKAMSC